MFTETLSKETKKALEILGEAELLSDCYLAGGTACALQLGHRISIDLDFFIEKEFDSKKIIRALQKLGSFELDQESWGTILGQFNDVRFSFFVYEYPILFPHKEFAKIHLADLRDIAAMKIDAISSRGIKRDFIDLYFICQSGLTLSEILDFYDRKYGEGVSNRVHIQKSLVYFEDADASEEPKMIKKFNWDQIKSFFRLEVKKIFL